MARPSNNPVVQQLELLMSGRGFNFYDDRNKARADDLLVRQRAGGFLSEACDALSALEPQFRSQYIPASTRANPYPPADTMAKLKDIGQLRSRVGGLETQIRSMQVPTQDKIWWRFRDEHTLLEHLVSCDLQLVTLCQTASEQIRAVTADDWHNKSVPGDLAPILQQIEGAIRDRQQFLMVQVI